MRVVVLASGSKGNATYIQNGDYDILLDCGINYRALLLKAKEANIVFNPKVLILTHEHNDHTAGMKVFLKNHNVPVFLSKGTFRGLHQSIKDILEIGQINFIKSHEDFYINDMLVRPFFISHDAFEPLGFLFELNEKKIVYVTDTGYIDQKNFEIIRNANLYIIEANHDPEMLMTCKRPYELKRRILGDNGHLSNIDCGLNLAYLIGKNTEKVIFAHISLECNANEIISDTILEILNEYNVIHNQIEFIFSSQNQFVEVLL